MAKVKNFLLSRQMIILYWVIGFLALWEFGATSVENTPEIRSPEKVLPHFYKIIQSIFDSEKVDPNHTAIQLVMENAGATLIRAGQGFLIGIGLGFIMALLMNLSRIVEKVTFPCLMIIQMIPILGMAPIILAITGDIGSSRIVIAAILTFYPVATNTLAGFKSVEREKHELMYSYAASTFTIYRKTLIPACIPYFFIGLKIAAPMAITASILVDTLQGGIGLGCLLSQSLKGAMTRYVFWQIVLISAVIGILSYVIMGVIERILTPYNKGNHGRR